MWNENQAIALKKVFDALDENGIEWAVFRNFDGLPNNNPSKDVDLLVNRKQISLARKVIENTMHTMGYTNKTFDRFQCIWCYSFFNCKLGQWDSIKIDLFYGQVWRGVPTVSFEKIYDNTVVYNGFRVPNPVMNAFLLWIKPIMTGGKVKEKYLPEILKYGQTTEFQDLIKEVFGKKFQKEAAAYFVSEKTIRDTCVFQKKMCRLSWIRGFAKHPFDSIASTFIHFFLEIIRRSRTPKNSVICLLGPDGVGKTTVINLLEIKAKDAFIKDDDKIKVLHFRPNSLPNLKKLLVKNYNEEKEEFTNPHRAKPAGKMSSLVRLFYYWNDYVWGWNKIRKECVNGSMIIFDRYSYDFIVDPKRSRVSSSKSIIEMFMLNVPQPSKVFILSANPNTIYARKQELELAEIERQVNEYKNLATSSDRFVLVDAEKSPEEITNYIMSEWIKELDRI